MHDLSKFRVNNYNELPKVVVFAQAFKKHMYNNVFTFYILLKCFCIFLRPNLLYNRLWNVDNKESETNEAAV